MQNLLDGLIARESLDVLRSRGHQRLIDAIATDSKILEGSRIVPSRLATNLGIGLRDAQLLIEAVAADAIAVL